MDAKQAIKAAKYGFADLFSEEPVQNVGLEEVTFDRDAKVWEITLGFYRTLITNGPFGTEFPTERIYKVITLSDQDGSLISLRNREPAAYG